MIMSNSSTTFVLSLNVISSERFSITTLDYQHLQHSGCTEFNLNEVKRYPDKIPHPCCSTTCLHPRTLWLFFPHWAPSPICLPYSHHLQHLAPPIISLPPIPISSSSYWKCLPGNILQDVEDSMVRGNSNHSRLLVWNLGPQTCPAFWVSYKTLCGYSAPEELVLKIHPKSFLVPLEQKALQGVGIKAELLPFSPVATCSSPWIWC